MTGKINVVANYIRNIIMTEIDGKNFASRKELAEIAKKTLFPAVIFLYYDGKIKDPSEWLTSLNSDKILDQINKTEE